MTDFFADGVTVPDGIEAVVKSAVSAALIHEKRSGNVSVLVTTEEEIRKLNREFRHVDRVTDVLTFPAWEGDAIASPPDGYLGDIAICLKRAGEQAEEYGHPLEREMGFLAVHGALHLMGYDHMTPEDEEAMFGKQKEILEEMGLHR